MTERNSRVVIAERRLVAPGFVERVQVECPERLGPPWRLHLAPESELIVVGLFLGMVDLFNPRKEFRPREAGVMESLSPTGIGANAFAGTGPGLPLHGPSLERGSVLAVDLFNRWLSTAEVWVSLWGTLP